MLSTAKLNAVKLSIVMLSVLALKTTLNYAGKSCELFCNNLSVASVTRVIWTFLG